MDVTCPRRRNHAHIAVMIHLTRASNLLLLLLTSSQTAILGLIYNDNVEINNVVINNDHNKFN